MSATTSAVMSLSLVDWNSTEACAIQLNMGEQHGTRRRRGYGMRYSNTLWVFSSSRRASALAMASRW